jgi:hypothetical protein
MIVFSSKASRPVMTETDPSLVPFPVSPDFFLVIRDDRDVMARMAARGCLEERRGALGSLGNSSRRTADASADSGEKLEAMREDGG